MATLAAPAMGPLVAGEEQWTVRAGVIVALCFVLNMLDGMDILVLAYVAPALGRALGAGPGRFAMAFSAGIAGMAAGGILLAPLADRFGKRPIILAGLALMAAAMAASARIETLPQLIVCRALTGTGIGTVLASIAALAAETAPPSRRAFAVGLLQAGYPLGAMFAGIATAAFLPAYGWRPVFLVTGLVTFAVMPFAFFILPRSRSAAAHSRTRLAEAIGGARRPASLLLWVATIGGSMALYFIASWVTKLGIAAGLPEREAIIASTVYNAGAVSGVVAMSMAANRVDIRTLAAGFLAAAAGAFLWFGSAPATVPAVLAAAFAVGFTLQGGFNALYPLAARVYPAAVRATGVGFALGIGRIGAFIGPIAGAWAIGLGWPLVAVFGLFCGPLLIAAAAARAVRFEDERV